MAKNRKIEQQIAVFGESGSGKTVLVSSFYGATQQQAYKAEHPYEVVADKQSQGRSLYQAYLGMRGSATVPLTTRFDSETYAFTVRAKDSPQGDDDKRRPFDAVQIAWHDYPGEWFAQDLEITIDIQASKSDGFDEGEVRTISENARVLKFDPSSGFES